eukprot:6145_1
MANSLQLCALIIGIVIPFNICTPVPTMNTSTPTQSTLSPSTPRPTQSPTLYPVLARDDEYPFIIPNKKFNNFTAAKGYCESEYNGTANIYNPKENRKLLRLITYKLPTQSAYIGYYKGDNDPDWRWESNYPSDPMLWISSPLATNVQNKYYPNTNCIYMDINGWHYSNCYNEHYVVCQQFTHMPSFNESNSFVISDHKLNFDDARSVCRSIRGNNSYYDLATIYEEQE